MQRLSGKSVRLAYAGHVIVQAAAFDARYFASHFVDMHRQLVCVTSVYFSGVPEAVYGEFLTLTKYYLP